MKRETPATTAKRQHHCITPRHRRLIVALLKGPLPRKDSESIIGTTNGPEYISDLRHNFGLTIKTERIKGVDRDGNSTRPGIYLLAPESRELAESLIHPETPGTDTE